MSSATAIRNLQEERSLDAHAPSAQRTAGWLVLGGAVVAALAAIWHPSRFFATYLAGFMYILSITLGALFFVIVQHLVRAGWSVTVRRIAEGIAYNARFLPFLFLPLVYPIYQGDLQPQAAAHVEHHAPADAGEHAAPAADDGHGDAEHGGVMRPHLPNVVHGIMDSAKEKWLSFPWLAGRLLLYFAIWWALAGFYYKTSVAQDASKDVALTNRMQAFAAPAMVLFALSTSLCGMDLIMALDPHWFSTIFGVYFFAGSFLSFNAALILSLFLLQRAGLITKSVSPEHYHDVGKFMFAFVVFWAYIAYSQYMLIWYGNLPEETGWYLIRQSGDWTWVGIFLVVGHFVLPFLLLLSRFPKRRPHLLVAGAVYILVVHYVDLYWQIQPQLSELGHAPMPVLDVGVALALVGVYLFCTVANLRSVSLVPTGDPRLVEALAHENY